MAGGENRRGAARARGRHPLEFDAPTSTSEWVARANARRRVHDFDGETGNHGVDPGEHAQSTGWLARFPRGRCGRRGLARGWPIEARSTAGGWHAEEPARIGPAR